MKKTAEKRTMFGNTPTSPASEYKALVQFEINKRKVDIDKGIFVKTEEEKDILRRRKLRYKESLLDGTHTVGSNEMLKQIAAEKAPRWGSCKVGLLVA